MHGTDLDKRDEKPVSRLKERDYTYFTTVRGMCRACGGLVPARVFFREGRVFQQALCPGCETEPAPVAADRDWYLRTSLGPFPDRSPLRGASAPARGCPHDCGPCTWHATPCERLVIPVDGSADGSLVDSTASAFGPVDLVEIAAGEGGLPPGVVDIAERCVRSGAGRVEVSTGGSDLAGDAALCETFAELGVRVILTLDLPDSSDRDASPARGPSIDSGPRPEHLEGSGGRAVLGAKSGAIENLTRAAVGMTLRCALERGANGEAPGRILDLMRENDCVRGLDVETASPVPVDEAAKAVCGASRGELEFADFLPGPSAHPLCRLTCRMVKRGRGVVPLAKLGAGDGKDAADGPDMRTVRVHAYMDEGTFDCSRAMLCPELVAAGAGRLVPVCVHDLSARREDRRSRVKV